jgi:hypothetical protein
MGSNCRQPGQAGLPGGCPWGRFRKESEEEALEGLPIAPGHAGEDIGVYARPMPTAGRWA